MRAHESGQRTPVWRLPNGTGAFAAATATVTIIWRKQQAAHLQGSQEALRETLSLAVNRRVFPAG